MNTIEEEKKLEYLLINYGKEILEEEKLIEQWKEEELGDSNV